jgi:hypothetical protein
MIGMKRILTFAIFTSCIQLGVMSLQPAGAVSITVIGHWNPKIEVFPLSAGRSAGPKGDYKSAVNQVRLSISGSSGPWKVYVRREDTNWHGNFVLKLTKTSGKTRPTVVAQDMDTEFFSGDGDGNFNVQIILEGVSLAVPPDSYTAKLIYTVTEE